MNLPTLLRDYATYNRWANQRLTDWLQTHPDELLTREVPSSFPSLRATLLHTWGAQHIWLQRLKGEQRAEFPAAGFAGPNAELIAGFGQSSQDFADFVATQPDDFFSQKTAYLHRTGVRYEEYNAEIIQHCLQHSTYHRGQLVTIARNLGLTDPPATDYILYVRNRDAGVK